MPPTKQDYLRLGDFVRAGRLELPGRPGREAFADTINVTSRTLLDIENGELRNRKNFSGDTMAAIERGLGWVPGTWRKILADLDYVPGGQQHLDVQMGSDELASVSEDRLVLDRPDGVEPALWEHVVASALSHIGWELSQRAGADVAADFMARTSEGRTIVVELKRTQRQPEAPVDESYQRMIAARRGTSAGRRQRAEQDQAGEAPDLEGPDDGA